MENILEVKGLKTSFMTSGGEVKAVRGVSFDVIKGEVLGIVGESGSGKSVTNMSILHLLAGTGKIVGGEIKFEGKDLTAMGNRDIRKVRGAKISMIFQDPMSSLNPLITVGSQVYEMIEEHNPKMRKEEIKKEVIRLFDLVRIPQPDKRYKSYPHEFSGGMRQRVMIAMALACKPDILIADEPTTALDVTIQDQILKLLKSLQNEFGMSIIFITHDLGVVAEICSRVIVMYGGLIMEEALVDDLFENPSHPYTKGLLQSIPNINQDKSKKLLSIPGSPPDMTNPPKGCPFSPRCPYARNICAEKMPPYTNISEMHRSMCWMLTKEAPEEDNPFKMTLGGENYE
ncbi:MAG: ABC transporter ATP-binding protein [Eubacteriales bacterium]|nr:ABC transporter ATP-binding protein [Eubacteriales bacterium]